MVDRVAGMSIAEFIERYDTDGPFELVNGEIIKLSPPKFRHSSIANRFHAWFIKQIPGSEDVAFVETTFALSDSSDWVAGSRVPDMLFYQPQRLAAYKATMPDYADKPLLLVPDLVIEIVSPSEKYSDVTVKMDRYMTDGVQVGWLIDPQQHSITLYRAGSKQQTKLTAGDTLTDDRLLPGFSVAVADVFVV